MKRHKRISFLTKKLPPLRRRKATKRKRISFMVASKPRRA